MRNLIARMETANETTVPNKSRNTCIPVKFNPNLISFKKLAPNIAGIARKNVNSAATPLDTPMRSAPTIVAPERDVPGISANA